MRNFFVKHWITLFALGIGLLLLRPILGSGVWYSMHDSTHPMRLALLQLTSLYQFPPIWADYINGGYGYPLFQFYAPLFHVGALIISGFGFLRDFVPVTTALKITLLLSMVTGIAGSMMWARQWGRWAAIVAGVLFAFAPYAALNIYVRGAYAEYLSMALLPWVFYTLENLQTHRSRVLAALVLALFILSHNLIPLLAVPIILVWGVYLNRANLAALLKTFALALGLSAWFVLPLLLERGFVMAEAIAKTTSYSLHFVEPWQLWNSSWGYGGSAPGVEDGMSFKLGKIQLLIAGLGVVYAFRRKDLKVSLVILSTILLIFVATPWSSAIWGQVSMLQVVQFPWRSLAIITVFLGWLGAYAVSRLPKYARPFISMGVIVAAMVLSLKYFVPQNLTRSVADSQGFSSTDTEDIAKTIPEYAPKWWQGGQLKDDDYFDFMVSERVQINDQDGKIQGKRPLGFDINATSDKPYKMTLGYAYYPTWQGSIDGESIELKPNEVGLIMFEVPEGTHQIVVQQGHTDLEKLSYLITTTAIIIALYYGRKAHGKS